MTENVRNVFEDPEGLCIKGREDFAEAGGSKLEGGQ
jgi:hypothetical protein